MSLSRESGTAPRGCGEVVATLTFASWNLVALFLKWIDQVRSAGSGAAL